MDGTRLGYDKTGSPITTGFEPQWHHVYPRSVLRKSGLQDDEINPLANITLLNERTNVNKLSGKEPWRYIQQFGITQEVLRDHVVPEAFIEAVDDEELLKKQWDVERYTDFLIERAQKLARFSNSFLLRLES